jgi:carboxypeptidase C (cathepsin A)
MSESGEHSARPQKKRYESRGKLKMAGKDFNYEATAAWLSLKDGDTRKADVFHTYYRKSRGAGSKRPLTFVFNGGPGAASAYLHVGTVGPKRVECGSEGSLPAAPARLVDNQECWLAFTDLVFVDPVGTGLSKTVPQEEPAEGKEKNPADTSYWDANKDLDALCEFIAAFLSAEGRWASPIHIAGESYGGYRCARLVRMLQEKAGIGLSGAMLISPAMEWDSLFASRFNSLAAAIRLPSYAAAARRHGRCGTSRKGESLAAFLLRAEQFALGEFLPAVAAASGEVPLTDKFIATLAQWTGLNPEQLTAHSAMPAIDSFVRGLLRDQGKVLGLYDAGTTTDDPFPGSDTFRGVDPTLGGLNRLYTAATNQHLRDNLGVDSECHYELLNYDVNSRWQWRDEKTGNPIPVGATEDLAVGLGMNPDMKLSIVHGIYDLVTPYFESKYLVNQLRRGSNLANAIRLHNYEGGHMFYMWQKSRREFARDAARMYR